MVTDPSSSARLIAEIEQLVTKAAEYAEGRRREFNGGSDMEAYWQGQRDAFVRLLQSGGEFDLLVALRSSGAEPPTKRPEGWKYVHEAESELLKRDGWMCETHPGMEFPHGDCAGPGMPWKVEGKAAIHALAAGSSPSPAPEPCPCSPTVRQVLQKIADDAGTALEGDYAGCVAIDEGLINQAIEALAASPAPERPKCVHCGETIDALLRCPCKADHSLGDV